MSKAPNNEAEYEALIAGIELCYMARADLVKVYSDSQLVVSMLNGDYKVKDNIMVAYCRCFIQVG